MHLFVDRAGEENLVAPVMPGAAFFNTFMQSVVMPRGPPEFVKKAFDREQPLSRSGMLIFTNLQFSVGHISNAFPHGHLYLSSVICRTNMECIFILCGSIYQ